MRERLSLSAASCSRGRALAAAGALAAVVLAATVILTTGLSGTSAGASKATKQSGAATVQRRDLVQSDTEAGTLSYANPRTVYNRMSGTITSLPVAGQVITPGGTLFRVDGAPVILMNGTVPAYRTLSAGVSCKAASDPPAAPARAAELREARPRPRTAYPPRMPSSST